MGILICIGTDPVPFRDPSYVLGHDGISHFRMMGKDHQFNRDVLIMETVDRYRKSCHKENGINGGGKRKGHRCIGIKDCIVDEIQSTYREVSDSGCNIDAEQIRTAG